MKLGNLLNQLSELTSIHNDEFDSIEIVGISANSEEIQPGYLFIAIPGYQTDGHDYIESALSAGAAVIVGEKDKSDLPVPYIKVSNSRLALAMLACEFYRNPSRNHIVIGITGTNGKTTTSFMLKHMLESAGKTCALFGSVYNIVNGQITSSQRNTTLDAIELQKQIAASQDDFIIIEVSSHGIAQHRIWGIEFDVCLFTNLDQDHLDYHHNMEEYFKVKASLFDQLSTQGRAVINCYDSWGEKLVDLISQKEIIPLGKDAYFLERKSSDSIAHLSLNNESYKLKLNMLGIHNFQNAAMAFLTASQLGINEQLMEDCLQSFSGVPGRFEVFQHPCGANFIVDYAHTAAAFSQCLQTALEMKAKSITHIFGFRGDRDPNKRREMADVSCEFSDLSILTFDDLNNIPHKKMEETLLQYHKDGKTLVIPDRTLAIKHAWDTATNGEWVIITGKGHENYQQEFELPTTSDAETLQYLLNNSNEQEASIS